MTTDDTAAARRKRLDDARIAAINAHRNAVPPNKAYLKAKADLWPDRYQQPEDGDDQ